MNLYALALLISLAVWFLIISTTSLLGLSLSRIFFASNVVTSHRIERSPARLANILFVLRTLPFFLALILALGIALPAFLENEPRSTGEPISVKLWLLAFAGAIVLAVVMARGMSMLWATVMVERRWRGKSPAQLKIAGLGARVYCVDSESPLLAVTGIFKPRIFVARQVLSVLSPGELQAAIAHEIHHVRRLDNLKQFLMNISRLPRWLGGSLDFSWTLASEVAADAGALAHGASSLELASALVKVAALKRGPAFRDPIAASHLLPDLPGSPLAARVRRLQHVIEDHPDSGQADPVRKWRTLVFLGMPVLLYVAAVSAALPAVHEALELLVR